MNQCLSDLTPEQGWEEISQFNGPQGVSARLFSADENWVVGWVAFDGDFATLSGEINLEAKRSFFQELVRAVLDSSAEVDLDFVDDQKLSFNQAFLFEAYPEEEGKAWCGIRDEEGRVVVEVEGAVRGQ